MLKKLITISITAIVSLQAATTYDKSLTDGNDDLNYWSDTTSSNLTNHTLVGATEVFTIGSRKNIPNVPTTSIKVSTNKLCSDDRKNLVSCSKSDSLEPRYTDDGLNTSGEANLRTWYKATTPKSVNGVVDNPCISLSNTGSVVNWAANFPSLRCERTITTYTPKVNSTIYTPRISTTTPTSSVVYANKISGSSNYAATLVNSYSWWTSGYYWAATQYQIYQAPQGYTSYTATWELSGSNTPNEYGGNNGGCYSRYYLPFASQYIYSMYYLNQTLTRYMSGIPRPETRVTLTCKIKNSSYTCPSGGTLSGTTCITPTLTCPATYTDNGTNCKKTVTGSTITYSCPSGYSDNGSNCQQTIQICPDVSWSDNVTNCKKNVPEYKLFSTF